MQTNPNVNARRPNVPSPSAAGQLNTKEKTQDEGARTATSLDSTSAEGLGTAMEQDWRQVESRRKSRNDHAPMISATLQPVPSGIRPWRNCWGRKRHPKSPVLAAPLAACSTTNLRVSHHCPNWPLGSIPSRIQEDNEPCHWFTSPARLDNQPIHR
jgi:hypothetical protein